ncbi:MAG: hypothetical protein ACRDZP_09760 [Acidimicrobiales bacterium]
MLALVIADTVLVVLLGLLVAGLLRSHADILRALRDLGASVGDPATRPARKGSQAGPGADGSGAPFGSPVPFRRSSDGTLQMGPPLPTGRTGQASYDLRGESPEGGAIAIAVGDVDHVTLLAFLSSGCTSCGQFWAALGASEPEATGLPAGVRPVIVTKGADQDRPDLVAGLRGSSVPVVMSTDAWGDYEVPGSPFFVLVNGARGQRIGEGTAASFHQVVALVRAALEETATTADSRRPVREPVTSDRDDVRSVDEELQAAGILPGDASLHPLTMAHVIGGANGDGESESR